MKVAMEDMIQQATSYQELVQLEQGEAVRQGRPLTGQSWVEAPCQAEHTGQALQTWC